jgi:ribonuclease T1
VWKQKIGLQEVIKIFNINKYLIPAFVAAMWLLAPVGASAQREAEQQRIQIALADISVRDLPSEARDTLRLIEKGGPYPYDRDGIVFGNFEKRLPIKERGYYNEFTVKTPGVKHRGARRIVTGKSGEKYYSEDHYNTFKRIVP